MRRIKRFSKKMLSGALAFLMLLSFGYTTVYASEDMAAEERIADVEADNIEADNTEANNTEESILLNYLVLEKDYVETPSTQYIVADVGNEDTEISEAVLTYKNMTTGASLQKKADILSGSTMLFDLSFNPEQAGQYQIMALTCNVGLTEYTIDIPATGAVAIFGVDTEVVVNPYAWILDEEQDTEEAGKCTDRIQDVYPEVSEAEVVQQLAQALPALLDSDETSPARTTASRNLVVVLDPGHGGTDPGASRTWNNVTYAEREINLKIAQYCKAELETYAGITVYMTRTDTTTTLSLTQRTDYARSVGADIFISLHINASTSTTATGAEVIVPNVGYNTDIHNVANDLGTIILSKLAALGINNRGTYSRDTTVGERYPDDSIADYYTVIYNSKMNGMPGMIVEHAFISNEADCVNFLGSDAKLQLLGINDATAIAEYFNLRKGSAVTEAMRDESPEPYADPEENISGFVASLYQSVLNRTPSRAEVSWWVAKVDQEQLTGLELARHFVNSQEFQNRSYNDEEYVEMLYEIFLERPSEPSGKAYWVSMLSAGTSRLRVAELIGNTPEFEMVCARYGMAQGSHSMEYVKLYPRIADFVTSYYNGLMNREPDAAGLEYWTKSLIRGNNTASDLTKGFINSAEFRNRNISREDFVEGLYQIYLGRASDPEGKTYWMGRLSNMSQEEKESVIRGFIHSEEYEDYCDSYGILVGDF